MRIESYLPKQHREIIAIGLAAALGAIFSDKLFKPKVHKALKVRAK